MSSDPKHFHDVGKAQPQPTSRPTIVGKPELARDPMMREIDEHEPVRPLSEHAEPTLTPPTLTTADVVAESQPPVAPIVETPALKSPDEASKEKQQLDSKLNQLIDSKTYAVPVGNQKRNHQVVVVLVVGVVVLLLAAAYVMMMG